MAQGLNIDEKFTLVNAPAGSGKTTIIVDTVKELTKTSSKNLLCITYTNRAANQLIEKISSDKVEISTIHSFLGKFMKPFFKLREVIDFFLRFYEDKINTILLGIDEKYINSRTRYIDRYGLNDITLSTQIIRENIKYLEYGETQFTSYLNGKLSHDDLLIFTKALSDEYPKLKMSLTQRYSYIFIDEFQDSNSEILKLFYEASLLGNTQMILLGDEMQQIYPETIGEFQDKIDGFFERDFSLKYNWRSQKDIVEVLNNIYFDSSYRQENKHPSKGKPRLHIVENLNDIEVGDDTLQLVLLNSELFASIGAFDLYKAYKERYGEFHKYKVKDILTNLTIENPDDLIVLLVFILKVSNLHEEKQFSKLIKLTTSFKFSNKELWNIKTHLDKVKIKKTLDELVQLLKNDINIEELLNYLKSNGLILSSYVNQIIEKIDEEIKFKEKIKSVKFQEFINCYQEMKEPRFSTQHAVKGEGHDKVVLKIKDGNNPNVKMYFFLELYSKDYFRYKEMMSINKKINECLSNFKSCTKKTPSSFTGPMYTEYEEKCQLLIMELRDVLLATGEIYQIYFAEKFLGYLKKPNVTAFKKCITEVNKIAGVLIAYKLFYVGCSRAKSDLDIYVEKDKIAPYFDDLISKFETIGFNIKIAETAQL
ncbi:UvrD-helicase domain-containing protein [Lysinibacillus sp. NPDC095746]|uniref:UvrD-helicase domain-containing protein n=1 Tax=Lysinibacillus sp. NPDC095746 TaxID=3364134 RepID=UPI003828D34B